MVIATESDYLTVAEAAKLLKVHPTTIRRWIADGRLPVTRLGERSMRIDRTALIPVRDARQMPPSFLDTHSPSLRRRLTSDEKRRGLEAIERISAMREEIRRKYGTSDIDSVELIRKMRDERDRELGL